MSNTAAATTAMLLTVSFYVIATTLPATVVYVLEDTFPQGSVHLSDAQITVDECWQRFFRYLTVRRIIEEVRSSSSALFVPPVRLYCPTRRTGGFYCHIGSTLCVCEIQVVIKIPNCYAPGAFPKHRSHQNL